MTHFRDDGAEKEGQSLGGKGLFNGDRRRSIRTDAELGVAKPNVKIAETAEEFEQAFRILHDVYVEMGYMERVASGLRMLPHHALPETFVFLARDESRVLGTASLILDSDLGLPMDDLYADDLATLRQEGRKLAEVSSMAVLEAYRRLVIDEDGRRHGLFWLLHQAVLYWARRRKIDHLCVTVNPRHVRFYQYLYFFDRVGEVKAYSKVKGAPAVALHLDLGALPARLAAASAESEKTFALGAFFDRFEHGFSRGDGAMPGMTADLARLFLGRTSCLGSLQADRAAALERRLRAGAPR